MDQTKLKICVLPQRYICFKTVQHLTCAAINEALDKYHRIDVNISSVQMTRALQLHIMLREMNTCSSMLCICLNEKDLQQTINLPIEYNEETLKHTRTKTTARPGVQKDYAHFLGNTTPKLTIAIHYYSI